MNYYVYSKRRTTMADIKKEQERDELHRAIWSIADDLRGSVDG
jgi:type I restriction enzyme M protein